jgi:hypothetical protein
MVGEILSGLGGFQALLNIAKSLRDMDDAVRRNAAIYDLREQILAAQARYAAAVEEKHDLEAKLTRFETWETEKKRYELKDVDWGAYAYILKPTSGPSEPPHWLCPKCYQERMKFILQAGDTDFNAVYWCCPNCKSRIRVHGEISPGREQTS